MTDKNTPCTSLRYLYPRSLFNVHVYLCAIYVPGHSLMPTVCAVLITDLKQKNCTRTHHVLLCATYIPGHSLMSMYISPLFMSQVTLQCPYTVCAVSDCWTVVVFSPELYQYTTDHNFWSSNRFSDLSCTCTHHNWPQFLIFEQVF